MPRRLLGKQKSYARAEYPVKPMRRVLSQVEDALTQCTSMVMGTKAPGYVLLRSENAPSGARASGLCAGSILGIALRPQETCIRQLGT